MKRNMPFGRFKGEKIKDLPDSYLQRALDWNIWDDLREAIERELYERHLAARYKQYKVEKKSKRNRKRSPEAVFEQNLLCAQIIAGNKAKYPGLMQEWASMVIQRGRPVRRDPHWSIGKGRRASA